MLSNFYRRLTIWWGGQLYRWEKRRYENRGLNQDD